MVKMSDSYGLKDATPRYSLIGKKCTDRPNTPGKNNLFRKSNARDNELHHENGCIKSSSQL